MPINLREWQSLTLYFFKILSISDAWGVYVLPNCTLCDTSQRPQAKRIQKVDKAISCSCLTTSGSTGRRVRTQNEKHAPDESGERVPPKWYSLLVYKLKKPVWHTQMDCRSIKNTHQMYCVFSDYWSQKTNWDLWSKCGLWVVYFSYNSLYIHCCCHGNVTSHQFNKKQFAHIIHDDIIAFSCIAKAALDIPLSGTLYSTTNGPFRHTCTNLRKIWQVEREKKKSLNFTRYERYPFPES